MSKSELLGIFRTALNNCKLVYASMILFSHDDMYDFFDAFYKRLTIPKPYTDILPLLRDETVLKHVLGELYDSVHRAALKELFETTKAYCQTTNQFDLLKTQPWYQFWRIVRNCFSHDMTFQFNEYDKPLLPVTWSGVTLDLSLEGKSLTHGRLSREKLRELLEEVRRFIEVELA